MQKAVTGVLNRYGVTLKGSLVGSRKENSTAEEEGEPGGGKEEKECENDEISYGG